MDKDIKNAVTEEKLDLAFKVQFFNASSLFQVLRQISNHQARLKSRPDSRWSSKEKIGSDDAYDVTTQARCGNWQTLSMDIDPQNNKQSLQHSRYNPKLRSNNDNI